MRFRFLPPKIPRAVLTALLMLAVNAGQTLAASGDAVSRALKLSKASLVVEEAGRPIIAHGPDRPMIPASTMKILTALAAIQRWGLDHRFHTDFLRDSNGWLWVKGFGDPFLVSEELNLIASALKARGIRSVAGIGLDASHFEPRVDIRGRSSSNNPYDAPVTALAANFNTLNVVRVRGSVKSAEAQTPLTPLGRQLAKNLGPGEHRINLKKQDLAVRYFGELLAAKLGAEGIDVGDGRRDDRVPTGADRIYRHHNSRDLRTVLSAMLKFSNNFIANDLFLMLGDRGDGRPIRMARAQNAMGEWVDETFGWSGYRIEDGAGLSRGNRLSARQLVGALNSFAPHRDLLPRQEGNAGVRAKTGTLRGVSCYAGFVRRGGRWQPFALLINQPVDYNFRRQVADALTRIPDLGRLCPGGSC